MSNGPQLRVWRVVRKDGERMSAWRVENVWKVDFEGGLELALALALLTDFMLLLGLGERCVVDGDVPG